MQAIVNRFLKLEQLYNSRQILFERHRRTGMIVLRETMADDRMAVGRLLVRIFLMATKPSDY